MPFALCVLFKISREHLIRDTKKAYNCTYVLAECNVIYMDRFKPAVTNKGRLLLAGVSKNYYKIAKLTPTQDCHFRQIWNMKQCNNQNIKTHLKRKDAIFTESLTHSYKLNLHPFTLWSVNTDTDPSLAVHTTSVCCPSTVSPMWRGACSQRQPSTQVNVIHMSAACTRSLQLCSSQAESRAHMRPPVLPEKELQAFPLLQLSLIEPTETHPGLCCHTHYTTRCHTPNYSLSPEEGGCLSAVREDTAAVTSKPQNLTW